MRSRVYGFNELCSTTIQLLRRLTVSAVVAAATANVPRRPKGPAVFYFYRFHKLTLAVEYPGVVARLATSQHRAIYQAAEQHSRVAELAIVIRITLHLFDLAFPHHRRIRFRGEKHPTFAEGEGVAYPGTFCCGLDIKQQ